MEVELSESKTTRTSVPSYDIRSTLGHDGKDGLVGKRLFARR